MQAKSGHMSVSLSVAAILAAAAMLAGCGSGGSATSVGPAGALSAAESVSPDPSASELSASEPSAAVTPTADARAAVEQAVRAYVDAANVAMATGDTAALRALSTPECTCLRLAESIEELYGSGGRAEGARWDLEDLTVVDVTGASAAVWVAVAGSAYSKAVGASATPVPAIRYSQMYFLSLESGWHVSDVDEMSRS